MTSATESHHTDLRPELPEVVRDYLAAHAARDSERALALFAPDPVVVDEAETYAGTERVVEFLERAGSEFTYTTTLVGSERTDEDHWVVHIRLEGNFPGGVADLRYRFSLAGGRIAELVIAP